MQLELTVNLRGQFVSVGAFIEIPEMFRQCFEPMKVCTDVYLAGMLNEVSVAESRIIMKTREDAAEIIAKNIADMLVDEMKKHDTRNGYTKDQQE